MVQTYNIIGHLQNIFYHNNVSKNLWNGMRRRMGNSPNNSIFTFFSAHFFHKKKIYTYCLTYLESRYGCEQSPSPSVGVGEHDK